VSVLSVETIPKRIWKNTNTDRIVEYDKQRKRSQFDVSTRIHYLWFHYLKLCLNLEGLNYYVEKKGAGGKKVISKTKIRVSKTKYKKWGLNDIPVMKFNEWYNEEGYRNLFIEGGFRHTGRPQYHSLITKLNVFIDFYNQMNGDDFVDTSKGDNTRETQVCSDIFENSQFVEFKSGQKERFDQLKKKDPRMYVEEIEKDGKVETKYRYRNEVNTLVKKDVKICGKEILSCCQGEFPKSV